MKIKSFLLLIYVVTGFIISLFTAIMTYIIIDEPIGMKMASKIALTVLVTLPVIAGFSYLVGNYLSEKFEHISLRLNAINKERFAQEPHRERIEDIGEIHDSINQLSGRLEQSIMELKEHNENLKNIIKSLSHDIKTPLTIMDGYLDEFEDGLVNKEQTPHVIAILKKETAYINELSSEVIEYLQSQEFVNHIEPITLKEFLLSEVFPLLRIKESITLHCTIDERKIISFNRTALKKILVNLLHNANKYTQEGFIHIHGDHRTLHIEDTGIGVDPKYHNQIFEPFFCLDESRNREQGGFGLGLSIAKNLAQNNGYDLTLDVKYRNGAKFILREIDQTS